MRVQLMVTVKLDPDMWVAWAGSTLPNDSVSAIERSIQAEIHQHLERLGAFRATEATVSVDPTPRQTEPLTVMTLPQKPLRDPKRDRR